MPERTSSAAERVSVERIHTAVPNKSERRANRTGLDEDLAWFLECGGSALGERGTLGGIVNALELGGTTPGLPNTSPYTDKQVGWGRHVIGDVERHRWLLTAWNALTPETQGVLLVRYMPPPAEFRSDEGYGARERWIDGEHPMGPRPKLRLGKRGNPVKTKQFQARLGRWESGVAKLSAAAVRTSVEAALGEWASLAIMLCSAPARLLTACRDPNKGNRELREAAVKAAKLASEKAHTEWAESKDGADPVRTRAQRVAVRW